MQRWRASGGELNSTAGKGVPGKGFGVSHWVTFWAHTFMALVPQLCSGTIVKRRFVKACCLVRGGPIPMGPLGPICGASRSTV